MTLNMALPLSEELYAEHAALAEQLNLSVEECLELLLSHFSYSPAFVTMAEATKRIADPHASLIDFPDLQEELDFTVKFHPMAMEELQTLSEEDQIHALSELFDRIALDELNSDEEEVDLLIKETPEYQVVLSEFPFGQVVYTLSEQSAVIYCIHIFEAEDNEEDEEEEEEEGIFIEENALTT